MNEECEYHIQFVETGENPAKALESSKQPFHLVSLFVQLPVVFPWRHPIALGRHHRLHAQIKYQLTCFVAFIGLVHDDLRAFPAAVFQCFQKLAARRRVASLTRRQRKGYGSVVSCCNQVNFGSPSASRFADRLRTVFFNAPVPSGWTLTTVESSEI